MGPHQGPQRGLVVRVVVEPGRSGRRRTQRITGPQRGIGRDEAHGSDRSLDRRPGAVNPGTVVLRQERPPHQVEGHRRRQPGGQGVAGLQPGGCLGGMGVELVDIEPVGAQAQTGVGPLDPLGPEHVPQPAHEHADLITDFGRPLVSPHDLGQHIDRAGPAPGTGQRREQQAGLPAADLGRGQPVDLEPAEQPHAKVAHARRS